VTVDIYGWDATESALRGYISAIADKIGAPPESTCCTMSHPANACIALDEYLPGFPDRDLALIWEETQGWAAAIETHCGEDLIVLAYLGEDPLPAPRKVVAFRDDLIADRSPGQPEPPNFGSCPDLLAELAARGYADARPHPAERVPSRVTGRSRR
jgi:Family of unknown function (DUF6292)